jgi:hypothetical protein
VSAPAVRKAVAGTVWRPDPTMVGVFTSVWSGYALANNESYATLIDGDPRAIAARVREAQCGDLTDDEWVEVSLGTAAADIRHRHVLRALGINEEATTDG